MTELLGNKLHLVCQDAVMKYGTDAQHLMVVEEMSELTKEICKFYRCAEYNYPKQVERMVDELADVYIMLYQLCLMHNCEEEVNERMMYKLERLEKRMNGK